MMQAETAAIESLRPWFHNIHLPDGTQTAPDHQLGDFPRFKWKKLEPCLPEDLRGWRALDIGCNAGYYSIELARRGAQVLGIDMDSHYLRQAHWVVQAFGLEDRITLREMQVYDLARLEERFDLVLFMGVFYHLRYPLLGLDIVCEKVDRLLVFQTLMMPGDEILPIQADYPLEEREVLREPGWPQMAFVEHRFAGDPTNWWVPSRAGVEALLRSAGMRIEQRPEREIMICTPDPQARHPYTAGCVQEEMRHATGVRRAPS
jgi:tRNA (mo5U34)-methyltransferase